MTDHDHAPTGGFEGSMSKEEFDAALKDEFGKLPVVTEKDVWLEERDGPIVKADLPIVYVGGPTHGQTSSHDPGEPLDNSIADGDGKDVAGVYARTMLTATLFGKEHVVYGWTGYSLT